MELPKIPKRLKECVLLQIFGVTTVMNDTKAEIVHLPLVSLHQLPKGKLIPRLSAAHQLTIFHSVAFPELG